MCLQTRCWCAGCCPSMLACTAGTTCSPPSYTRVRWGWAQAGLGIGCAWGRWGGQVGSKTNKVVQGCEEFLHGQRGCCWGSRSADARHPGQCCTGQLLQALRSAILALPLLACCRLPSILPCSPHPKKPRPIHPNMHLPFPCRRPRGLRDRALHPFGGVPGGPAAHWLQRQAALQRAQHRAAPRHAPPLPADPLQPVHDALGQAVRH